MGRIARGFFNARVGFFGGRVGFFGGRVGFVHGGGCVGADGCFLAVDCHYDFAVDFVVVACAIGIRTIAVEWICKLIHLFHLFHICHVLEAGWVRFAYLDSILQEVTSVSVGFIMMLIVSVGMMAYVHASSPSPDIVS